MKIRELGKTFDKRGFTFVEDRRSEDGSVRVYRQMDEQRLAGLVVAKINTAKPPESWESEYDEHEVFPSAEQFGKTAWQYTADGMEFALDKLEELLARPKPATGYTLEQAKIDGVVQ